MSRLLPAPTRSLLLGAALAACAFAAEPARLAVRLDQPGKPISPELFGVFFEDLSAAADGGLYAELVQNRSFEYSTTEKRDWNNLTSWELIQRGGGRGAVSIETAVPVHPNNPHYAVLDTNAPGGGVGLANGGFDGIAVREGARYDVALFARKLFAGGRWDQMKRPGDLPLVVRLEDKAGVVLGETSFQVTARGWTRLAGTITATRTEANAQLVLLTTARGGMALDEISLFPQDTFRRRPNGLRADLAQAIADLRPKFVRFPGGCLVHGHGLDNLYRWQDTIGPIEQRRQQPNLWGYHQTVGLGYFEYFQFCEDIGAQPLPVVPAAVCCQNADHQGGTGQSGLPLEQMPAFIQSLLDLIEYANGPASSPWGAKRAAAGHPEPFHLRYLGVGNEDAQTDTFRERFRLIQAALAARHPEIAIVGTVGPFPDGEDFDAGWKFAREQRLALVDEHYYKPPSWFWSNLARYDTYDRSRSHVYVGEYAAHDDRRRSTLRSALAEAAFLTSLERNGDVVRLSSYAPLLAKRGRTNWSPDLIYFTNTAVFPTINYHVQQLFSTNGGDTYLTTILDGPAPASSLAASTVRDRTTGDVILKLVNGAATAQPVRIEFTGAKRVGPTATRIVLTAADANAVNEDNQPPAASPQTSTLPVAVAFDYEAPANSLTVLRLKTE